MPRKTNENLRRLSVYKWKPLGLKLKDRIAQCCVPQFMFPSTRSHDRSSSPREAWKITWQIDLVHWNTIPLLHTSLVCSDSDQTEQNKNPPRLNLRRTWNRTVIWNAEVPLCFLPFWNSFRHNPSCRIFWLAGGWQRVHLKKLRFEFYTPEPSTGYEGIVLEKGYGYGELT